MKSVTNSNRTPFHVYRNGHDDGLRSSWVTVAVPPDASAPRAPPPVSVSACTMPEGQGTRTTSAPPLPQAEDQIRGRGRGRGRRFRVSAQAAARISILAPTAPRFGRRAPASRSANDSGCLRRFARYAFPRWARHDVGVSVEIEVTRRQACSLLPRPRPRQSPHARSLPSGHPGDAAKQAGGGPSARNPPNRGCRRCRSRRTARQSPIAAATASASAAEWPWPSLSANTPAPVAPEKESVKPSLLTSPAATA